MKEGMIDAKTAPYGVLLLRVSIGILFLFHGVYLKAFLFGMTAIFSQAWGYRNGSPGWSCCTKRSADWR